MQINLSNSDLRWAHWRNIPPENRPQSTSFSLDEALQKLQKLRRVPSNEYQINWSTLKFTIGMSREEAHFWIEAIYKGSDSWYKTSLQQVVDYMSREGAIYDGKIDLQALLNSPVRPAKAYGIIYTGYHIIPAYVLLDTADFVQFINESLTFNYLGNTLEDIFRLHILPYLGNEEKEAFRKAVAPYIAANDISVSRSGGLIGIAGLIGGMDAELEQYLDSSVVFSGNYIYDRLAAFGLSSREKVEHYVRSKAIILHDEYIQAWLAHTELNGLDWLAHSIAQLWRGSNKEKAFKIFKSLLCPQAVLPVLSLWEADNNSSEALTWLVDNPKLVAETLVPLAFTEYPQAKLIQKYLQRMQSMQQTAALEAAMLKLDELEQTRFRAEILEFHQADSREMNESNSPAWLNELIATVPERTGFVDWVDILALPPLTVKGLRLNPRQIKSFLVALRSSNLDFITAINEHVALEEREAFVWALFQSWIAGATPNEGLWTLNALAKMGGDGVVLKLTPLIERWPSIDPQNRHAKYALDVLRDIGSDTAFLQLENLGKSKKLRSATLKQKANTRMQEIARQRGLSQLELEDRLIPDCGLDKNGSRLLDFGSRQFTFILSPEMKATIREANGKIRVDLPKANQSDDVALVAQAAADWERIKSQIKDIVKTQTARLETALVQQRRWSLADFQSLFVQHPLMLHIIRRLLWGAYDEAGKLQETFRVDEARQLLNAEDKAIAVANVVKVGILHPAELSEERKQVWGELLSDYEIIPPFRQLASKINRVEAEETELNAISRFATYKIDARVLRSILEKSGWQRSFKQEDGIYYFSKYFYTDRIRAIVVCTESPRIQGTYLDQQSVSACYFINNPSQHHMNFQNYTEEERMRLGDVAPVVFSETLRILHAIAGKAT